MSVLCSCPCGMLAIRVYDIGTTPAKQAAAALAGVLTCPACKQKCGPIPASREGREHLEKR